MRLLLDEMWSPAIASELRGRGHQAEAVAERVDLCGTADEFVFAIAQAEMRAIVTEDIAGYRLLALQAIRDGQTHAGLIFTSNRAFPRSDRRTAGRLVAALDQLLTTPPAQENLEHWLT